MKTLPSALALALALSTACGQSVIDLPVPGLLDPTPGDPVDAGMRHDAGPRLDAGPVDAGPVDAGSVDAGRPDAGRPDGGFTKGTSPQVVLTSPDDGAGGVDGRTAVSAWFDRDLDPSTVTPSSFVLLAADGAPVAADVRYLQGRQALLLPSAPLAAGGRYTAWLTSAVQDPRGDALDAYTWSFVVAGPAQATAPRVLATVPPGGEVNVGTATAVSATFDQEMDPLTLDAAGFQVLLEGAPVAGQVQYGQRTATFTPDAPLAPGARYQVTLSGGCAGASGAPLGTDYVWGFTTLADAVAVVGATPLDLATAVATTHAPQVTFSEPMRATSLTPSTFFLTQNGALVAGQVRYDATRSAATFVPAQPLRRSTRYTATVTTGATGASGHALAQDYRWTFTTAACSQEPAALGALAPFGVLAATAVSNQGPTGLDGALGVSPGAGLTGFAPTGPVDLGDAAAAQAMAAATTAYVDLASRSLCPVSVAGNLGGQTLGPGLYRASSALSVASGDLTLDAQGEPSAVFIFQVDASLDTTSGRQVVLAGGAQAANVFWQVAGGVSLGSTSRFEGTLLASEQVAVGTGATVVGRLVSLTDGVTLDSAALSTP
jgi:hypothetical protein